MRTFKQSILLLMAIMLFIPLNVTYSAQQKVPTGERLRYTVDFIYDYNNSNIAINVRVTTINFDDGSRATEDFDFYGIEINPTPISGSYRYSESGLIAMSPTGLKAYGIYNRDRNTSTTLYEFDMSKHTLRKIKDSAKGHFITKSHTPWGIFEEVNSSRSDYMTTYYSLSEGKPVFKASPNNSSIRRVHDGSFKASIKTEIGDLILSRYGEGELKNTYLIEYGGKLTPIKINYPTTADSSSGIKYKYSRHILSADNSTVEIEYLPSDHIKDFKTKIILNKNNTRKVLYNGIGFVGSESLYSVSPKGTRLVVFIPQYEKALKIKELNVYIYDLQKQKLIRSFKAHYRLGLNDIQWFTEDLVKFKYSASQPSNYPAMYYHIPSGTSTKSENPNDWLLQSNYGDDSYYWDTFSYEGLKDLNNPKVKRVEKSS